MSIVYKALPSNVVRDLQSGLPDANGRPAQRFPAPANGAPCRHCLRDIPEGEELLLVAYRPFDELQPYAEVGPVFLCAEPCERHPDTSNTPELFLTRENMLIKGYDSEDRIIYATCQVVPCSELTTACNDILSSPETVYVHIRSATANCYQCRVERAA